MLTILLTKSWLGAHDMVLAIWGTLERRGILTCTSNWPLKLYRTLPCVPALSSLQFHHTPTRMEVLELIGCDMCSPHSLPRVDTLSVPKLTVRAQSDPPKYSGSRCVQALLIVKLTLPVFRPSSWLNVGLLQLPPLRSRRTAQYRRYEYFQTRC